jgi:hypothetical protein
LGIVIVFVIFLYYITDLNLSNKICFIIFRVQMNPTQIFEFAMNWINQKIVKFNWVPLGQNRARPNRTVRAWPAATRGMAQRGGGAR